MRTFKLALFLLALLFAQTVLLPFLTFFGAMPDLFLVAVIVYAVMVDRGGSTIFAAGAGFLQDLFSSGIYVNTLAKVLVNTFVGAIGNEVVGDVRSFAASMVAIITPLYLIVEGLVVYFWQGNHFSVYYYLLVVLLTTIYNLVFVPVVYHVLKNIVHE
ncbi:rod shape-determining protein MreD [candidate division WOR-1 bacterium RIFOXYA12_FULL_52_29]|uniref:Rod shape-determining protein MreD n=1 Tax=candidate division WOR-1 bacterium RIFOXYC12_FULL_54_18 TaxID=1802584 RepID=A0A1F4T8D2_UNCSA|nr:MAG: rod shape-determining protein MreD [candidate division WOR-1 bacterium RIFOXYA2_FULL_51_19]OGC18383.1 MAG: rod shape-determining protein MreD [candidate division WOR-1 bacterium RIFOXYA12_FULL_52_29]OGC27238.1 MAG: rod shape-determining protein MreD [candidate division WOR-1 bacterium RIFOXYB2_FULL_45_9]OGC28800.1 MAG: rod shape-determining protein MreD [candidate division WOR-1 bacterium RIFOXYC12_FULL_54_18]OGC30746.1 MAG: rod shape-determining protein MreD [candidate division WOR-1 b